jgi:hypothetical protein
LASDNSFSAATFSGFEKSLPATIDISHSELLQEYTQRFKMQKRAGVAGKLMEAENIIETLNKLRYAKSGSTNV